MQVGDHIISTRNLNGLVDSGTTITYFPRDIFNNIITYFNEYCEKNGNKCGKFETISNIGYCGMFGSKQERVIALNKYWPNITLFLEGYNYTLTPNDYNFEYNDDKKIGACLGFEGESCSKITIGGTFMHGHDIIFDKENQMMGFAEADCNRGQIKTNDVNNYNINDNDSPIKEVKDGKQNNKIDKFNEKFLYGIIIVSSLIVICLIILVSLVIRKKYKFRKYNSQVDESTDAKKNKNNNILEIKNQNTNNINHNINNP
jgi:cell division protein FtsL